MSTMNKATAVKLREALEEALGGFGEHFNVEVNIGRTRYGRESVTMLVEFALPREDGVANNEEARDFRRQAPMHGIKADVLGTTIKLTTGEEAEVVGWNRRAIKYPVTVKTRDGTRYKLSADALRERLARRGADSVFNR
jgi:hypothetical protein